ncbi:hypothetical protein [Peterkaempfera bronchialis]|uniref:hypothetical protein n=1 Tax=Peterkaempfera bronchialis TaxID=2126346 RepID=UPI0013B45DA8|nr:hypothetical protein [Peterkaempfera bronchialis]
MNLGSDTGQLPEIVSSMGGHFHLPLDKHWGEPDELHKPRLDHLPRLRDPRKQRHVSLARIQIELPRSRQPPTARTRLPLPLAHSARLREGAIENIRMPKWNAAQVDCHYSITLIAFSKGGGWILTCGHPGRHLLSGRETSPSIYSAEPLEMSTACYELSPNYRLT